MVETRRSSAAAGKRSPTPPSTSSAASSGGKRSKVETGASPPREKEPVSLDEPTSAAPDEGVVAKTTSSDRAPTVQMVDDPLELSARGMIPV
ncbi:hypothetical protein BHE74_00042047 [Ensete ventricosum]|nr:hypothetical protein BHE74_00042047 [Ensete ventricosum]RZS02007.1 hypothetical protein BHM03_00031975 [Ensete ventricosum]